MEVKLTSSDIGLLFANVLNNILSDNCNLFNFFSTMNCLRWYGSSAHLVNCAYDQTRRAADHFIKIVHHLTNCAIFGQSRSALAIGLGLIIQVSD